MSNIKDYRNKELPLYITAQIFLIVIFQNQHILNFNFNKWQETLINIISSTVFSSTIGVFSFVFDSMFSNKIKHKWLYFGIRQPGEKIFENIKNHHNDFRYTKEKALEKYKEIYDHMPESKVDRKAYENGQWYQIYFKHRNVSIISTSHRDYLLCRDIYFATIVIITFYVLISFLLHDVILSWKLLILEAALLVASNTAARQRGKSFVANVIAYDLQERPEEPSII